VTVTTETSVRERIEAREDLLSPHAQRSASTAGREVTELPSPLRTEFQRDRDRIIHSMAFRRLKHKTQVFVAPQGDHYVTRLTHTLEVSQIARTIARALNLNEDLTEAIALGHDLGHTPFGHVGEDEVDRLVRGSGKPGSGFRHAGQSLRVVEALEKEGSGLNLTTEVRHGIASHSKPQGDFLSPGLVENLALEAQIVRVSDAVAYLNHDLMDAFRAGVLDENEVPRKIFDVLGTRHSQRIDRIVTDIVQHSSSVSVSGAGEEADTGEPPMIMMGPKVRQAVNDFRAFMFERVYVPQDVGEQGRSARAIVGLLFGYYSDNPDRVPPEYRLRAETGDRAVIDHISGMTDHYAMRKAEALKPGISGPLTAGVN
jgi:dGTPase